MLRSAIPSSETTEAPEFNLLVPPHIKCHDPPEAKNLPKLFPPFFGREANMSYLEHILLSDSVHVLGINGPPGFGKSTLAIHLGESMRTKHCFYVGYVDLERQKKLHSYVVASYNERRLADWNPPLELTSDSIEEDSILARNVLEWFQGRAMLIVDNCDYVLQDKKSKQDFLKFLAIMIQNNDQGRIVITSEEKLNLDSPYHVSMNFEVGGLSDEASVKLLKYYPTKISNEDAKEISVIVENCPIALRLIGSDILPYKTPKDVIARLRNRKDALKLLNKAQDKHLNFIMVMDEALSFLTIRMKMSAMFVSFFPGYFSVETAVSIMTQSDKKYNSLVGIIDSEDATDSIEDLKRRSLLDISAFAEVMQCKMHRLIKVYFMDRGNRYDGQMEAEFNSSFRIYFSNLGVRRHSAETVRARENELLSSHDGRNFDYLTSMLLLNFNSHLFSDDELVYLAIAFHKGMIHYDNVDFQVLLQLYTYRRPQVADLYGANVLNNIASDFDNFFVNVLCNVTTPDVCINIYLDLLYKLYVAEKCSVAFEDNMEDTCRMVNCDYANDYFRILDELDAFSKCSDAKFCKTLFAVNYMCSVFQQLLPLVQCALGTFFLFVCVTFALMFITCFKFKNVAIFFCKHFFFFILIVLTFLAFSYTLVLRKFIGLYLEAPLEVHLRNVISYFVMLLYTLCVYLILLHNIIFFYVVPREMCSLLV